MTRVVRYLPSCQPGELQDTFWPTNRIFPQNFPILVSSARFFSPSLFGFAFEYNFSWVMLISLQRNTPVWGIRNLACFFVLFLFFLETCVLHKDNFILDSKINKNELVRSKFFIGTIICPSTLVFPQRALKINLIV